MGGVEKYVQELSTALVANGDSVVVMCAAEPADGPALVDNVRVLRLPYSMKVANTNVSLRLPWLLMREDVDVIHTHLPTPWSADVSALVSFLRRKPLIITYHNDLTGVGAAKHVASLYNRTILRLTLHQATRIVITQKDYLKYSAELQPFSHKVATVPVGVTRPVPVKSGKNPNQFFFLSVLDKHHEYKGLGVLLEAVASVAARHPTVSLRVGGGGELIEKYRRYAKQLGIGHLVDFLGYVPEPRLPEEYASSTAFVLPSINSLEGFGIVALEALTYGTPVITTELAGSSAYIRQHDAGYVVQPGSVSALAQAMLRVLSDPIDAAEMGRRGQAMVTRDFAWEASARTIRSIYSEALRASGRRPPSTPPGKLKVVVVAPYFPPKTGGLESYAFHMATELVSRGHEIVVISADGSARRSNSRVEAGMRIYRLPYRFKLSNTPFDPRWLWQIRKIIKNEMPDLVNAHTPVPVIADIAERVAGKVPFVLTYHNDLVKSGKILGMVANFAYPLMIDRTIASAAAVITTSKDYALSSAHLQQALSKVHVVPPGVDTRIFHLAVDRSALATRFGAGYTVLFVGQLDHSHAHKGVSVLLAAVARLQRNGLDIKLVVAGPGDAAGAYADEARQLGLQHTHFLGHVPDDELPAVFAGADVTVLASTTEAEGFGMVLLEAGAVGRPVIGSRIGGLSTAVVEGETGLLVPPGDVEALAQAIKRLHDDAQLGLSMGSAGARRAAADFSWSEVGRKTEAVFEGILSGIGP
ncbi:hypothetical protein acdb102_19460 [Acidothermaceae bacterium B102]|nr:hypothetical protein acdb102_19460 [Acidothermaceae bacterium B102]